MVPKLRFKEYKNKLSGFFLGDLADVTTGDKDTQNKVEDGVYPFFVRSQKVAKINSYSLDCEAILTSGDGVGVGKDYHYINGKFDFHQRVYCIYNFKKDVSGSYLYHYFSTHFNSRVMRLSAKNSVDSVRRDMITKMSITLPEFSEQTKIADFLSSVEEKITLLNKQYDLLCEYKKGMMQKIFSQQLRLKDENGEDFPEWEIYQLKDVADRVTRKNKENNQTILTISGRDGLVDQMSYFNKQIASKNVSGYYLINNGEFAYNKSYSQGYPMGAIKMLTNYDKGVVSTLYICFKLNSNQSNSFYQHYFESGLQNRSIEKVAQEGARNHGLLNIGVSDFFDIELHVPGLKEQTKIANFLSAIGDKITTKKVELDKLKTWKQGLLQQMFV